MMIVGFCIWTLSRVLWWLCRVFEQGWLQVLEARYFLEFEAEQSIYLFVCIHWCRAIRGRAQGGSVCQRGLRPVYVYRQGMLVLFSV